MEIIGMPVAKDGKRLWGSHHKVLKKAFELKGPRLPEGIKSPTQYYSERKAQTRSGPVQI